MVDQWDSQESFDAFMRDRLVPAIEEVGVAGPPEVTTFEVHNTYKHG